MTKDDILNSIKYSLGYPRIDIEIEDDVIESFIDVSISKISDYADTTKFITLPALSCQDFKLGTVLNIYNNENNSLLNNSFVYQNKGIVFFNNGLSINLFLMF